MIIKKYRAKSLEEAQKIYEEELGPDAIVLTSQPVRETGIKALFSGNMIEVTVAIDEKDLLTHQNQASQKESITIKNMPKDKELKDRSAELTHSNESGDLWIRSKYSASADPRQSYQEKPLSTADFLAHSAIEKEQRIIKEVNEPVSIDPLQKMSQNLVDQFGYLLPGEQNAQELISPRINPSQKVEVLNEERVSDAKSSVSLEDIRDILSKELQRLEDRLRIQLLSQIAQDQIAIPQQISKEDSPKLSLQAQFLISKGVNPTLARQIDDTLKLKLAERGGDVSFTGKTALLKEVMMNRLVFFNSMENNTTKPSIYNFFSSSSVGKSSLIAQIASNLAERNDWKIAILTLDPRTIHYDLLLGKIPSDKVTLLAIRSVEEMQLAMAELIGLDAILIDYYSAETSAQSVSGQVLKYVSDEFLSTNILVANSMSKECDIYYSHSLFHYIKLHAIAFTALDTTIDYGSLFNITIQLGLPISYFSFYEEGQLSIETSTKEYLVRLLLLKLNDGVFEQYRRMAMA